MQALLYVAYHDFCFFSLRWRLNIPIRNTSVYKYDMKKDLLLQDTSFRILGF
jgi:hypothetical protein